MAPLQPLQQTVFEQGPQTPAVPTAEPAFVYQEGQVILPEPINPAVAIDPGINWYGLGEQAMGTAQKLLTETWDYLIRTKANTVAELGDKYQSQLNELYQKQTTEMFNANKEKRPTSSQVIQTIAKGIQDARENFKKESIEALGDDAFFRDTFKMSEWGLKYQELALLTRKTSRDLDTQASKILYDAQRVSNEVQKEEQDFSAWIGAAVGERPGKGKLPNGVFMGLLPLPQRPDGYPVIGFNIDPDSNMPTTIKTTKVGDVEVPVVVKTDDGWFINPAGLSALDSWDEFQELIRSDLEFHGPRSGLMSKASGQPTVEMEALIKQTLEYPNSNTGQDAYVASFLGTLPDNMYENMLKHVDGLNDEQRGRADILRMYARSGATVSGIKNISGLRSSALAPNVSIIRDVATKQMIHQKELNPDQLLRFQRAQKLLAHLSTFYGMPVEVSDLVMSRKSGEYYTDTEGQSAARILQENPGLKAPLLWVMTLMDSNPDIDVDNNDAVIGLFETAINRSQQIGFMNSNTNTPVFMYAPNLNKAAQIRSDLAGERVVTPDVLSRLDSDYRESLKTDPTARDNALAQGGLYSPDWFDPSSEKGAEVQATDIAKRINPFMDDKVFTALFSAGVVESTENGYRTQASLPFGQLLRMTVAASPTTWEGVKLPNGNTFHYREGMPFEEIMEAVSVVWNNLDPTDGSDNVQLGLSLTPVDIDYMSAPRGGIPLQIKQIKGKDGADYLSLITKNQQGLARTLGAPFTPRYNDGTVPVISIKADTSTAGNQGYLDLKQQVGQYLDAKAGVYKLNYVGATEETTPSTAPPNPAVIISRIDRPVFDPAMQTLREGFTPLSSFENFQTFLVLNNDRVWDIMESRPNIADLKLRYEVAMDRNGQQTYEENKTLFSETNLRALYEKGINLGAQTNNDILGLMFRGMELYKENDATMVGREVELERQTNSSFMDFLGQEGPDKNVILYSTTSDEFYKGVWEYLENGFNLYQKGSKYYMMTPTDLPDNEVERRKYRLVVDAMSPDSFAIMSEFAAMKEKQNKTKIAMQTLFKPRAKEISETPWLTQVQQEQFNAAEEAKIKEAFRTNPELTRRRMGRNLQRVAKESASAAAKEANKNKRAEPVARMFESPADKARREYAERKAKENQD